MAEGFFKASYNVHKTTMLCIAQNTEITCQFRDSQKNSHL